MRKPMIADPHGKGTPRRDQGFLGGTGIWMDWAIFSNRGTFGITNRTTFLSNHNAESGNAQSKEIPQELSGIGKQLDRTSGNIFPLYWEINVTLLSTGREKLFPLFGFLHPGIALKGGYSLWNALSTSSPRFGTRIAKAGV
jgi:hypothetical protein